MTCFEAYVRVVKFTLQSILDLANNEFLPPPCRRNWFGLTHRDSLQHVSFYCPACHCIDNFNACVLIHGRTRMNTLSNFISKVTGKVSRHAFHVDKALRHFSTLLTGNGLGAQLREQLQMTDMEQGGKERSVINVAIYS